MRISRFLALVCSLVVFWAIAFDVGLANETDFRLKYSWPSLDIEGMPAWAPQPRPSHLSWGDLKFALAGVGAAQASINMWEDRLGLLTSFELGQFDIHGIAGDQIINPGTAGQRTYEFQTHTKVLRGTLHGDMRIYLGNFIKKWSEAELKPLVDSKLAFILGWHWQHYKFDRYVSECRDVLDHQRETNESLLPWSDETDFDDDHGGSYKLKVNSPEIGLSVDWKFFDEISLHFLGRYFAFGQAEYFGVKWQDKIRNVYGCDGELGLSYDFAKLFELKDQRLSLGLGYEYRMFDGSHITRFESRGAALTVGYGFKHTW